MTENFLMTGVGRWLVLFTILAPGFLVALTLHELAHGAMAYALGDPTAKKLGRLTLNPLKHLDAAGTIVFILSISVGRGIGWGKPVPVDGRHFDHPRRDMALVSLAGPATNFALAAFFGLILRMNIVHTDITAAMLEWTVLINIGLGVFNLIPLPPLDGSRLLAAILPVSLLRVYEQFEGYGIAIMFGVIFFFPGVISGFMSPFMEFFSRLFLV